MNCVVHSTNPQLKHFLQSKTYHRAYFAVRERFNNPQHLDVTQLSYRDATDQQAILEDYASALVTVSDPTKRVKQTNGPYFKTSHCKLQHTNTLLT